MESHTSKVLSPAPFQIARAKWHACILTLAGCLRTLALILSICAAHATHRYESNGSSHRDQLVNATGVHKSK